MDQLSKKSFYLTALLIRSEKSSGISFCIIKSSLKIKANVRSGFADPTRQCAFCISVQSSWPTWLGLQVVLRIAFSPCFTGSNKTLLKKEKSRMWSSVCKAITELMRSQYYAVSGGYTLIRLTFRHSSKLLETVIRLWGSAQTWVLLDNWEMRISGAQGNIVIIHLFLVITKVTNKTGSL